MNLATIELVLVILASYIVGALTSSIETERELPHRFNRATQIDVGLRPPPSSLVSRQRKTLVYNVDR